MRVNHNRLLTSIPVVILILLTACQPQQLQQQSPALALTAALKELTGAVDIKQPGASNFSTASVGMTLQQNGAIQTGDDGRARLDLSTGTIIRVSPSSVFTLVSNQPNNGSLSTQLSLTLGRIFVILKGGSLNVNTPSGVASVRGSYLSVYVDPNTLNVYITCLEGDCGASNTAGSVNFGTGQQTMLFHCDATTGQCTLPVIGSMTPEDYQNWLNENPEVLPLINDAYATLTALAPPSTESPASTPTPVPPTATSSSLGCLNITSPSTGSNLDSAGPATFSWDAKEGASSYKLTINYPNGASASFYTNDTSITRYAESMPAGGSYSWSITAYNNSGAPICQTSEYSFSKPQYVKPTLKPKPQSPATQPPLVCNAQNGQDPNSPCYCELPQNYDSPWCSIIVTQPPQ